MRVFAISDLHLSLGEKTHKPMDVFGAAWDHYEERLSEAWLRLISPADVVLVPGDISWAMHLEEADTDLKWLDALPGTKLLIKGNHDLWWTSLKKMQGKYPSLVFLQNSAWLAPDRSFGVVGTRGWLCPGSDPFTEDDRKIYRRELLRLQMSFADLEARCKAAGMEEAERKALPLIAMTHFPPTDYARNPSGFTDAFEAFGIREAVYGHLHTAKAFANGPVGTVNGVSYRLISLDRLACVPVELLKDAPQ